MKNVSLYSQLPVMVITGNSLSIPWQASGSIMNISTHQFLVKLIAALILVSSISVARISVGLIFSLTSYTSISGFLVLLLNCLPFLFIVSGSILLILSKQLGFYLIYAGYLTSLIGMSWRFIPFVNINVSDPILSMITIHGTNSLIVGVLIFCQLKEARANKSAREGLM